MLKFILNKKNHIVIVLFAVFVFLGWSLHQLTIVEGDAYYERSINNRIKKVETLSKRGEIYDRNGKLLATNSVGFTLELNSGVIPSNEFSEITISIIDFLETQNETHIDFPIQIVDGAYHYTFDRNIKSWLSNNGYNETWTAEEVFNDIRAANYLDDELSNYEAYRILYNQGKYLPISTSRMMFLEEIYKKNFLDMYGLPIDISAEEAFKKIRSRSEFHISKSYSDEDAYKILIFRHAIKSQGYLSYEPIVVAPSISEQTAILVQEKGYDYVGLSVGYTTVRTYPEKSTAAHILGYMGPIATETEIETYVNDLGYSKNQIIGKTGIEGVYEKDLHGENGYKYIEVDVYGKYVSEVDETAYGLDIKASKSGDDLILSIDYDLQKVLENSLDTVLSKIRNGELYENPWGDFQFDAYPNAETGAGVVVDVKTGEVLAMASYPAYDVNLFSQGISQSDWNALNPVNKRNPLAARPLYNIASMMVVQPGSVYKMATAYAALEQGLDPTEKLFSDGYIEVGNHVFGCWYWNDHRHKHGLTDLYKALEVSCNYYFYNISNGYDYYKNRPLNFEMGPTIMTESSKQFGLGEKTGIEIGEVATGVPDPDRKKLTIQALLKRQLKVLAKDYFPESITENEEQLNDLVDEIVSWSDDNPSRGALINKLFEVGSNPDYYVTEQLADIIKYDYFNLMKWYESDTMNLSIGQGDHTYTPVQIARYISTIANGGYLNELTLVKQVGDEIINKNQSVISMDPENYLVHIQKGMRQALTSQSSSLRHFFNEFPIEIAGKTGTAQKEGLIPPLDEVAYLTEYLEFIAPKLTLEDVELKTLEIIKQRSEEMSQLEKQKDNAANEAEADFFEAKFNRLVEQDYLNKGTAMRLAIKELSEEEISDDDLNQFRLPYDNYSWFASYAPYDNPEIAVVILVPQGGSGSYSAAIARDVYAQYFKLKPPTGE